MSLVILRKEFLNLIQAHQDLISDLPKQVVFCAAKLIQYFSHWTGWKVAAQRTRWIYQPLKKIYEDLMGEHSLHVIRAAIALLEKIGLIKKRHNPNGQDKTWQYQLKLDVLSNLLMNEHGSDHAEHREFNAEQHTQIQSIDIKSTTNVDAEKQTESTEEELLTPEVIETEAITEITEPSSTPRITTTPQPTEDELHEVERQLRELRVNAAECKGVIRKYWANVQGAIALVKNFKGANKPIAVFINACKKGLAPTVEDTKRRSAIPEELRPPTHEESGRLDAAKERRKIRDYYFSTVEGITKVVLTGGRQLPWWEFLEISQC